MSDWLDIHAYADGQLEGKERASLEERLRTCKKSQAELQAILSVKSVLRDNCQTPDCQEVWQSCRKRLDEIDKSKRVETFVGKYAWGLCAVFFLMILGGAFSNRMSGSGVGSMDVTQAAMSPFAGPKSQERTAVKQWLNGVLEQPLEVQPEVFQVTGGASGETPDGRKIVRLNLADGSGPVALFVVENADRVDGAEPMTGNFQSSTINGMNCVSWTDKDCAFLLVGDRPLEQLGDIAGEIYRK